MNRRKGPCRGARGPPSAALRTTLLDALEPAATCGHTTASQSARGAGGKAAGEADRGPHHPGDRDGDRPRHRPRVPRPLQAAAHRAHRGVPQHVCQPRAAALCRLGATARKEGVIPGDGMDAVGPLDPRGRPHCTGAPRGRLMCYI